MVQWMKPYGGFNDFEPSFIKEIDGAVRLSIKMQLSHHPPLQTDLEAGVEAVMQANQLSAFRAVWCGGWCGGCILSTSAPHHRFP